MLEFIYDFVSVPGYLAWKSLGPMTDGLDVDLVLTPVLCAGIFNATGNPGPLVVPAKTRWLVRDLQLWARKRGVTLVPNPATPVRTLPLMRGSLVAAERGETRAYVGAMFDAIHVKARNPGDLAVLENCLDEAGLDARAYLDGIQRADIKQGLLRSTEDAVARGVFGVPSFFVEGELFFGQDRLEFVVEALRAAAVRRAAGQG